jgi:hypothetical protein
MKKRTTPGNDPVVPKEILEEARRLAEPEGIQRRAKCSVCQMECAPNSAEGLCWVCRRLKISAWRDSDSQMAAQE